MNKLILLVVLILLLLLILLVKPVSRFNVSRVPRSCKNLYYQHQPSINQCRQDCSNLNTDCDSLISDYLLLLDMAK
jgi:hypothetical protein